MPMKTVIITGASSGIGKSTALMFAADNCKVYNFDRTPQTYTHPLIEFVSCDVSNFADMQKGFDLVMSKEKELNYLFANSGIHLYATIEESTLDAIDSMINIDLKGQIYALKCAIPIMKKQATGGRIVLMGSDTTKVGKPSMTIYGATKAAIGNLVKSIAIDYAALNIRINCICPGTIQTEFFEHCVNECAERTGQTPEAVTKEFTDAQPVKKLGTPEEVAKVVKFLCSDDLNFMTGALVSIDGGYTCQ